jgi:hypothetical protein
MVSATFRFYGTFIAPARRDPAFNCACARAATTKHMVEALGVPHTEVNSRACCSMATRLRCIRPHIRTSIQM